MITDYIGGEGSAETPKNDYVIYGWPLTIIVIIIKYLFQKVDPFFSPIQVEKKDEWKSDKGNVGNKTKTFPQLHHFPSLSPFFPPYQDEDGHREDGGGDDHDEDGVVLFEEY